MKKRLILILAAVLLVVATATVLFAMNVSAETTYYDLWVAGTQVTSDTLSGSGWRYEPDTGTLVLNGFSYGSGGYGYRMSYDSNTKTDTYAFIYVKDTNRKAMNLNIRLEGAASTIGDTYLTGYRAVSAGSGYYSTYYGIYNPYGNVTITGSARLNIYTNQLCINASNLNINGSTVDLQAYSACASVTRLNVRDGSKLTAYCGFGGGRMYNTPIYAEKSINLYDSSEISSTMERNEKTDDYGISGIICSGTINVYGGKLSGVTYAQGKTPTISRPACIGIDTKVLNVTGGGVVEAFVLQGSGQKSYLKSTGICYYYAGNGTVNVNGGSVVRAGVEKKNPDGSQVLLPKDFNVADGIYGYCTALTSNDYESYCEHTAFAQEGAFVRLNGTTKQLAYYRNFRLTASYPSDDVPALSAIIPANSGFGLYVLSGTHIFDPRLSDGTVPEITVESGKLTLKLQGGKTYTMTKPVYLSAGTELVIEGDGIVTGLDVRGEGKVTFTSGTVTGSVASGVEMIVNGGNLRIDYSGTVKNGNGNVVRARTYTLTNDKTFSKVELVKMREREYGSAGIYPLDGKTLSLWTTSESEVLYARAALSDGKSVLTLNSQAGTPTLLAEGYGVKTNDIPLYLADSRGTVLDPFATTPTAEQMADYTLVWSHSRDGDGWTVIEDAAAHSDSAGRYTRPYSYQSPDNRYFRCEIYSKSTGELAGVFTTFLHTFVPVIIYNGFFVEGEEQTIYVSEQFPLPEGFNVKWEVTWSVSKDGGATKTYLSGLTNQLSYTFTVTEEMEGWIFECGIGQSVVYDNIEFDDFDVSRLTVYSVEGKTVKIDTQPTDKPLLDLDNPDAGATLTVAARNATNYQWQVSKRLTADQTDCPFENIPGANEASYTLRSADANLSMANYVYRCVIRNDVNEVITDEVQFDFRILPFLYEKTEIGSITLNNEDQTVFSVTVHPGLPEVTGGLHIYWEVSGDGGETYKSVYEYILVNRLTAYIREVTATVTPDGQSVPCKQYRLEIVNADLKLDGLVFRCRYKLGYHQDYQTTAPITLTVIEKCTQYGHTGGTATCRHRAVCEVCGKEYGELNPNNHTGEEKWNVKDWNIADGHMTTWSCCGQIGYPYERHTFVDGICNVCGCVCDHSLKTAATCLEEGHCDICGLKTEDINPDNHDLSLGTYVSDKKSPTCSEDGHEGNVICRNCYGVVTPGAIIPKLGHHGGYASCIEKAKCSDCGTEYGEIDPDSHRGEINVVGEVHPTCQHGGYTGDWYCLDCGVMFRKGEEVSAMDGHMGVDGICIWCGTRHGFTPVGDDKYTYYDNGKQVFGWFDLYDVRYYASRVTGIVIKEDAVLGGRLYLWDYETGFSLANGFRETEEGIRCYLDGYMVTGWRHTDGSGPVVDEKGISEQYSTSPNNLYYFLSTTGFMVTDSTYKLGGFTREFNNDHTVKPLNGLQNRYGELYYYVDGVIQTGWHTIDGNTYYFRASDAVYGRAATKWMYIGNKVYYFYASTSATPYALKTSGAIGGITYNYAEDGHILYNGFVNCEFANEANSNTAPNIQKKNGTTRYYVNGEMQTGWQQIGGKWYYFFAKGSANGSGYMCVESRTIGGVWYEFNEDGVCLGKKNN